MLKNLQYISCTALNTLDIHTVAVCDADRQVFSIVCNGELDRANCYEVLEQESQLMGSLTAEWKVGAV